MSEKKTPEEISKIRASSGAKGGKSNSTKKAEAARENGKLGGISGGRPRKPYDELSERQKKRRDSEKG